MRSGRWRASATPGSPAPKSRTCSRAREIDHALQALIDAGHLERATIRDPRTARVLTVWRPVGGPAPCGAQTPPCCYLPIAKQKLPPSSKDTRLSSDPEAMWRTRVLALTQAKRAPRPAVGRGAGPSSKPGDTRLCARAAIWRGSHWRGRLFPEAVVSCRVVGAGVMAASHNKQPRPRRPNACDSRFAVDGASAGGEAVAARESGVRNSLGHRSASCSQHCRRRRKVHCHSTDALHSADRLVRRSVPPQVLPRSGWAVAP
jgi:hypothetical protein